MNYGQAHNYYRQANNVLFNYVTPNQQQQCYYQYPDYGYQQQNLQPGRYVCQLQPKITYQPVNYVHYYPPKHAKQPVHQNIQYKPVVQRRYPEAYHFQYSQQNVNKMTKDEIDEINRNISEVKKIVKKNRWQFEKGYEWVNDLKGVNDKGNIVMTSNPRPKVPLNSYQYQDRLRNHINEANSEKQFADNFKNWVDAHMPISTSYYNIPNTTYAPQQRRYVYNNAVYRNNLRGPNYFYKDGYYYAV